MQQVSGWTGTAGVESIKAGKGTNVRVGNGGSHSAMSRLVVVSLVASCDDFLSVIGWSPFVTLFNLCILHVAH